MVADVPLTVLYANLYIRIAQCLGLCPFSIKNGKAFDSRPYQTFMVITMINFAIHLFHFLHSLSCMDLWMFDGNIILSYIDFFSPLILRIQAIVIIIESFLKRGMNAEIINSINLLNFILTRKLRMKNIRKN